MHDDRTGFKSSTLLTRDKKVAFHKRVARLYYLGNRWELEAVLWSVSQADVLVEMTEGQPLNPSGYRDIESLLLFNFLIPERVRHSGF